MIALWFLAGGAVEVLNTLVRAWSVGQLRSPERVAALVTGGLLIRLLGTALVLAFAFRQGFASGIAAFAGYYTFRWIMIAWVNRRYPST
jgi:hypothetical protein